MTESTDNLSQYPELQLRIWLEDAVRNYVDNRDDPFRGFLPLVIPQDEHLAPAIAHYFFLLSSEGQQKFRRAISDAAHELSPFNPVFTRTFAAYCEIAAYVTVPTIVEAIRAHLLVGHLKSPRTELELEAGNIAIQALDMMSPRILPAKALLRELYSEALIRANHPTALLSAMCEIEPLEWPLFVRDFTNNRVFDHFINNRVKLVGPLENVVRATALPIFAKQLYQLVELLPMAVVDLLFSAFFSEDDSPLILISENAIALHRPRTQLERMAPEIAAYRWYVTSRDNFDVNSRRLLDDTNLVRVEFTPHSTIRADGDFLELVSRHSVDAEVDELIAA